MTTFPSRTDGPAGKILVLGNGILPSRRRLEPILKSSLLTVCCDGAADKALRLGIRPDVVIGDLDSVSAAAKRRIPKVVRVRDQDSTDLEKALDWLDREGLARSPAVLAGFTGGRTDFTLYNLHVLKRFSRKDLSIVEDQFVITAARSGRPLTDLRRGTLISLLALARTTGVTTTGLKWNLRSAILEPGGFESASNRAAASTVAVSFKTGFLLWFVADAQSGGTAGSA